MQAYGYTKTYINENMSYRDVMEYYDVIELQEFEQEHERNDTIAIALDRINDMFSILAFFTAAPKDESFETFKDNVFPSQIEFEDLGVAQNKTKQTHDVDSIIFAIDSIAKDKKARQND